MTPFNLNRLLTGPASKTSTLWGQGFSAGIWGDTVQAIAGLKVQGPGVVSTDTQPDPGRAWEAFPTAWQCSPLGSPPGLSWGGWQGEGCSFLQHLAGVEQSLSNSLLSYWAALPASLAKENSSPGLSCLRRWLSGLWASQLPSGAYEAEGNQALPQGATPWPQGPRAPLPPPFCLSASLCLFYR